MRSGEILAGALVAFTLLGLAMFGFRASPDAPAPEPVPVASAEEPEVPPVPKVSKELLDRLRDRLAELEGDVLPVPDAPPVTLEMPPEWTGELFPIPVPHAYKLGKLPPLPKELTPGRRAALHAILEGDYYLLYFGIPPGMDPAAWETGILLVEGRGSRRLRYESVGDTLDPQLEEFVDHFNLQMLHALQRKLLLKRNVDGIWSAAANLDPDADEVLFSLLDDPTDAIATEHDPETGICELDLGRFDGVTVGMRFVLWTQARPLRRVLALVEVEGVDRRRCRVRLVRSFSDAWPATPGIRASNPFFHRGRKIAGTILGLGPMHPIRVQLRKWPPVSIYDDLNFPDFCVVGDVSEHNDPDGAPFERARKAGAIFVPARLVPYLLPPR